MTLKTDILIQKMWQKILLPFFSNNTSSEKHFQLLANVHTRNISEHETKAAGKMGRSHTHTHIHDKAAVAINTKDNMTRRPSG